MGLQLGRYETLRPIAAGGMATVHLGRAVGAGGFERLVAIKVMHPHVEAESEFVSMFLDEARVAAQIRHPNVVATIDLCHDPLFLVMEYVEGPSLHAVLRELRKTKATIPLGVGLRIVMDALAGLHAAHELKDASGASLGVVHRDVTPHNVLLGTDGVTKLTDFGVARAESRIASTHGGRAKGKLAYMSPEQVRAAPLDRRSDVFAAAVLLHEVLTGEGLFRAENEAALVFQVAQGAATSPAAVNPAIPELLSEVCMRALATEPAARYATVTGADGEVTRREIEVQPGATATVSFAAGSAGGSSAGGGAGGELRWVGVGAGAVGVAAFVVAIGTGVAAGSLYSEVEEACGGVRCQDPSFASNVDEGRRLDAATTAMIVVGSVLAAASVPLIVFGGPGDSSVSARVGPGGAWLRASF
jgi:serine/threonine-protein kinase